MSELSELATEATTDVGNPVPDYEVTKITDPSGLELCDRCLQAALWRVTYLTTHDLRFCGHHARRYGFAGDDSHHAYPQVNRNKGSDH